MNSTRKNVCEHLIPDEETVIISKDDAAGDGDERLQKKEVKLSIKSMMTVTTNKAMT